MVNENQEKKDGKVKKSKLGHAIMGAGGLVALLSCGAMAYDECANIDGDGKKPTNSFTSHVLGVDRFKSCEKTYEDEHSIDYPWTCGPTYVAADIERFMDPEKGVQFKKVYGAKHKVAEFMSPAKELGGAGALIALGAYIAFRSQRKREMEGKDQEQSEK